MKELICKICDKQYKTIQSLCNHNKRFHEKSNVMTNIPNVITDITVNETTGTFFCKYCNNEFKKRQNKWAHEKKYCKKKSELINKPIEPTIINNTPITNIINNTNNGTINNNITINNYMNDNIEYISDAFIKKMFNHLKNKKTHIIPIPKMIENIKFNSNHKENSFFNKKKFIIKRKVHLFS